MGAHVILDESAESALDDASILDELKAAAYGEDNRPAWIGAHRPTTNCDELRPLALWAAAHYAYYLTFVRDWVERRGDVLDIGCGAGQNTAMLARYAENATGIDSDAKGIRFALKHNLGSGAMFICSPFSDQVSGSYDYIFCIETIEHVAYEKQIALIDAALGMLCAGGRMFITTPNETSASPNGPHHGIWTPEWMGKMMERFGARVEKRGYFSNATPSEGFVEMGTHHALVLK